MKAFFKRLRDKTTALLRQGLTKKKLIQSIIVSTFLSIIPILGMSSLMITAVSVKWKLNLPIMITFGYVLWPVQIFLIIPFIRIGELIFSVPQNPHSIHEIINSFQNNFIKTFQVLSFELLCGLAGWLLTALPMSIALYCITLLFLKED